MSAVVVAGLAVSVLLVPVAATAQEQPTVEAVEEVLATSKLRQVMGGMHEELIETVSRTDSSLDSRSLDRIEAAAGAYFSEDSLYVSAFRAFREQVDPALFGELRGWLLEGPIRVLSDRMDQDRSETLVEYAQRLRSERPPARRLELASRLARAQRAAQFYFVTTRGVEGAARAAVAAVRGTRPPDLELPAEARDALLRQFHTTSVVSFLQQLEPLSDDEAAQVVEVWESRSGEWYAETYTNAVWIALQEAGRALVRTLTDDPRPGGVSGQR